MVRVDNFDTGAISLGNGADDVALAIAFDGARLQLAGSDGDGFLASVLPPDGLKAEFDLGLEWSHQGGLRFHGNAALPEVAEFRMEQVYLERSFQDSSRPLCGTTTIARGHFPRSRYENDIAFLRREGQTVDTRVGITRGIGVDGLDLCCFGHGIRC